MMMVTTTRVEMMSRRGVIQGLWRREGSRKKKKIRLAGAPIVFKRKLMTIKVNPKGRRIISPVTKAFLSDLSISIE